MKNIDAEKLAAVYVRVRETQSKENCELENGIHVDYDAEAQLVGIEFLTPCEVRLQFQNGQNIDAEKLAEENEKLKTENEKLKEEIEYYKSFGFRID